MTIHEKLMSIQKELKAPKGQYNSFGKYSYRSCEDILTAVKPLLEANKLTLTISDDVINLGDRFYIKAIVKLIDITSGESIETTAFAREDETKKGMDLAQITGSTSSYARKYALNGLFCIDDTKDSDFTNADNKNEGNNISSGYTQHSKTNSDTNTYKCSRCDANISQSVNNFSISKFKKSLCMDCQKQQ